MLVGCPWPSLTPADRAIKSVSTLPPIGKPSFTGGVLFLGCLVAILENISRTPRRS